MKIAILDDYQQLAIKSADWKSLPAGTEVKSFADNLDADRPALVKRLQPFDAIVAMRERTRFPDEVLAQLPNLKLLISTGGRNPSIDAEACKRRNIALCAAHGAPTESATAEVAWALVMALVKRIPQSQAEMRAGRFQEKLVTESLAGKTLGVLGLGRLGKYVSKYGQAFGMNVIAWSPHLTPERAAEVNVRCVSKEALFAESDVISLHLVSNASTRGIVGAAEIGAMKRTAYLVNTSRGPLIDEQALIAALQEKRIAGAGLDVFWTEPLQKDHVLRKLDNVVLTPHLGYVVDVNMKRFYENALKNVKAYLAGEPLTPMGR